MIMKKILLVIFVFSTTGCSKKIEEFEIKDPDLLVSLKEQINKPEKYPLYLYYRDFGKSPSGKTLIDSTFNKEVAIENLSLIVNKKIYDIRKINNMSWFYKQSNQISVTSSMEIIFIK